MREERTTSNDYIQLDIYPDFKLPESANYHKDHMIEALVYTETSKWGDYKKGDIKIQLIHQCDEWIIGGIKEVNKLIEGLKYAQKRILEIKDELK